MSVVLLDALGTLIGFESPAPRLQRLLSERHATDVTEEQAGVAMRAEIAFYREQHDMASDRHALAQLRTRCAVVLRDALPAHAHGLEADDLVPTLLDAIRFFAFPEVAPVLDRLRARGHALAVVSNWDVSLHDVLEEVGIADRFACVVTSAEERVAKPDPELFHRALRRLDCRPEDAVHCGDTVEEDVVGAWSAGVAPVLVWRQDTPAPATDAPVVADLRGLLELVS